MYASNEWVIVKIVNLISKQNSVNYIFWLLNLNCVALHNNYLFLFSLPTPHEAEQSDHCDQSDHSQSTEINCSVWLAWTSSEQFSGVGKPYFRLSKRLSNLRYMINFYLWLKFYKCQFSKPGSWLALQLVLKTMFISAQKYV